MDGSVRTLMVDGASTSTARVRKPRDCEVSPLSSSPSPDLAVDLRLFKLQSDRQM